MNQDQRLKTLRRRRLESLLGVPALVLVMVALEQVAAPEWLYVLLTLLACGLLVFVLVLNARIRRVGEPTGTTGIPPPAPVPRLARSIGIAAGVFALDAFLMCQGVVSAVVLLLVLVWMVPSAVKARKEKTLARFRAWRAVAYSVAALTAVGVIRVNNGLAEGRADLVITAVQQYQDRYGRFPDRLEQVTPVFIPSIPVAKYTLTWNRFSYFASPTSHRLVYVVFPPFARRVYDFESSRWTTLD